MTYENAVKLIGELEGSTFTSETEIGEIISKYAGAPARCYDADIDNGCNDEEEDNYVMYACYEIDGYNTIVRVYYGDVTGKIGYVTVDE